MSPVHREVLRDEIAFADEVVLLGGDRSEVLVNGAQDALQALAALGPAAWFTMSAATNSSSAVSSPACLSSKHLRDDFLRTESAHDANFHRSSERRRRGRPPAQRARPMPRAYEATTRPGSFRHLGHRNCRAIRSCRRRGRHRRGSRRGRRRPPPPQRGQAGRASVARTAGASSPGHGRGGHCRAGRAPPRECRQG